MTDILTFCDSRQHQHCLFSPFYQIFAKLLEASQRQQTGGGSGSGCLSTKLDSTQNKLCLNSFDTKAQHKGTNENSFQRYEQGLKAEDKKDDH